MVVRPSGMSPKWGFVVAMLPVGALYFYHAHVGRTMFPNWPFWAHFFYSVSNRFQSLRGQTRVAQAVLLPGALFHAETFVSCRSLCACPHVPPNPTCACSRICGFLRWHAMFPYCVAPLIFFLAFLECLAFLGAKKSTQTFSVQSSSGTLRVMDVRAKTRGRPHQKVGGPAAPVMGRTF